MEIERCPREQNAAPTMRCIYLHHRRARRPRRAAGFHTRIAISHTDAQRASPYAIASFGCAPLRGTDGGFPRDAQGCVPYGGSQNGAARLGSRALRGTDLPYPPLKPGGRNSRYAYGSVTPMMDRRLRHSHGDAKYRRNAGGSPEGSPLWSYFFGYFLWTKTKESDKPFLAPLHIT